MRIKDETMKKAKNAGSQLKRKFGQRVAMYRARQRLNQSQLAERVGFSDGFIKLIEAGRRWPRYENLVELARALHVTVGDLLEDKDEPVILDYLKEASAFSLCGAVLTKLGDVPHEHRSEVLSVLFQDFPDVLVELSKLSKNAK